eukprot:COSAG01_NODE_57687_length_310_cov_2.184834_1_plen_70_part_01
MLPHCKCQPTEALTAAVWAEEPGASRRAPRRFTLLGLACAFGRDDTVQLLLGARAEPDGLGCERGRRPLH